MELRERPDGRSRPVPPGPLRRTWVGLGEEAAWAFGREGTRWFEVEFEGSGRRAWIFRRAEQFTPLEELLDRAFSLALNERWPKRLYRSAGGGEPPAPFMDGRPTVVGSAEMPAQRPAGETTRPVTAPVLRDGKPEAVEMKETRRSYAPLDIPVHATPSDASPILHRMPAGAPFAVARTFKKNRPAPTFGEPMPPPPLAVLEVRGGWYRVQLLDAPPFGGGQGWVEGSKLGPLHRFESDLEREEARETLWGRSQDVGFGLRLLDKRWVEDQLWLSVEVLDKNDAVKEKPLVLGAGWLPIFDGNGQLVVDRILD